MKVCWKADTDLACLNMSGKWFNAGQLWPERKEEIDYDAMLQGS
jgi:hypothetical protein